MKRSRWALAVGVGALLASAAPAVAAPPCDPFGPRRVPRRGPDAEAGDRHRPRRARRHHGGVRRLRRRRRRRVAARDRRHAARSVQGRDLRYAIVGNPDRVTPNGLARIRASAAQLMDPSTRPRDARAIARRDPAILWIAGNVHGGEESGTDASLRVLWELADRSDCAAQQILDEALVVILPTQNPDGREADTRRNAYGFDMNRDWFARTQPETDGKVELLRRYPPVLFIDAHEMGGTNDYFFPPNADPIYHETPDQRRRLDQRPLRRGEPGAVRRRAGSRTSTTTSTTSSTRATATRCPATGFGAAGMTFEKSSGDPRRVRVEQQYLTQWNSLSAGRAARSGTILEGWHADWVEAERQGRRGRARAERGRSRTATRCSRRCRTSASATTSSATTTRPRRARSRRSSGGSSGWTSRVRRLTRPLPSTTTRRTAAARAGRCSRPARTSCRWSRPRSTGCRRCSTRTPTSRSRTSTTSRAGASRCCSTSRAATRAASSASCGPRRCAAQADPGVPPVPADQPSIALYSMSPEFTRGIESSGWLRYLLDRWGLDVHAT